MEVVGYFENHLKFRTYCPPPSLQPSKTFNSLSKQKAELRQVQVLGSAPAD